MKTVGYLFVLRVIWDTCELSNPMFDWIEGRKWWMEMKNIDCNYGCYNLANTLTALMLEILTNPE